MVVEAIPASASEAISGSDHARINAFKIPGVISRSKHLLRSGRHIGFFVDIDPLLDDPTECKRVVDWYVDTLWEIRSEDALSAIDSLAFIEKDSTSSSTVGVIRIAGAVSIGAQIPHVIVRLGKEIISERIKFKSSHFPPLQPSERYLGFNFVLVTDHCTSGAEAARAIEAIEASGGRVCALLAYSLVSSEFNYRWFANRDVQVRTFLLLPDHFHLMDFPYDLN